MTTTTIKNQTRHAPTYSAHRKQLDNMDARSLSRLLLGQLEKKRPNKRRQQQTSDDDDDDDFFLGKYPKRRADKRTSRKKRQHEIRQLMKQAKILISTLSECHWWEGRQKRCCRHWWCSSKKNSRKST